MTFPASSQSGGPSCRSASVPHDGPVTSLLVKTSAASAPVSCIAPLHTAPRNHYRGSRDGASPIRRRDSDPADAVTAVNEPHAKGGRTNRIIFIAKTIAVNGEHASRGGNGSWFVGRSNPQHAAIEGVVIDIEMWRRSALQDGVISADEAVQAIPLLLKIPPVVGPWVQTMAHIGTCLGSPNGMFGVKSVRGWKEAHARKPENITELYPEGDEAA